MTFRKHNNYNGKCGILFSGPCSLPPLTLHVRPFDGKPTYSYDGAFQSISHPPLLNDDGRRTGGDQTVLQVITSCLVDGPPSSFNINIEQWFPCFCFSGRLLAILRVCAREPIILVLHSQTLASSNNNNSNNKNCKTETKARKMSHTIIISPSTRPSSIECH